jgi:hypothetical protein
MGCAMRSTRACVVRNKLNQIQQKGERMRFYARLIRSFSSIDGPIKRHLCFFITIRKKIVAKMTSFWFNRR